MTTNRVRRRGSFAPLSARYYTDDAVMQAGEKAEVLFTRGLAFSADTLKDGYISELQVANVIGIGMRDATARAEKLCEVGLWLPSESGRGFVVRSWLGWNLPSDVIQKKMDDDAARKVSGK